MELIDPWFLYLWTRLDPVLNFAEGCQIVSVFIAIATFMFWGMLNEFDMDKLKNAMKIFKGAFVVFLFGTLVTVTIPNKKDAAIIYVIPAIANNENIQEEAKELYDFAKAAMKEYLPAPKEEVEK